LPSETEQAYADVNNQPVSAIVARRSTEVSGDHFSFRTRKRCFALGAGGFFGGRTDSAVWAISL